MARFQVDDLLQLLLLLAVGAVEGCHSTSKELHICLNIYLERDFPIVETILKGRQTPGYAGGRILLEGPDLQNICWHILVLEECYSDLLPECNSYWQLERYQRLLNAVGATYDYLCGNSTDNVRDALLNGACIRRAESTLGSCADLGISWTHTWKEILRMQVSASDKCPSLLEYRMCFLKEMQNIYCGEEAANVYGMLIDLWLSVWCSSGNKLTPFTLWYLCVLCLFLSTVWTSWKRC